MRQITIPDWLKELPGHATLNSRDMAKLFDYDRHNLDKRIACGSMPEPSYESRSLRGQKRNQWYVKDVIKFINEKGATK